jgi:MoxR-like ATPase
MSRHIPIILAMGGTAAVVGAAQNLLGRGTMSKLEAAQALAEAVDQGRMTLGTVRQTVALAAAPGAAQMQPYTPELTNPQPAPKNPDISAALANTATQAVALRAESLALQATQEIVGLRNTVMLIDGSARTQADNLLAAKTSFEQLQRDLVALDTLLGNRLATVQRASERAGDAAAAAKAAAAQAVADAALVRIDPAEVTQAVAQAVASAFKPFHAAVVEVSAQTVIGAMVQTMVVDRLPCLQVFGIDLLDRAGQPVLVDIWDHADAPAIDPCFIWSEPILAHLLLSQDSGDPIWLGGEKGTGKTQTAMQWAAKTGRGFTRINFSKYTSPDDYLGATGLENGATVFQPQAFLKAYSCPSSVILLDEITNADPGNLAPLNGLLEPGAAVNIGGTVWRKATGVMVMAADNTLTAGDDSGRYAGTRPMNPALADRFSRVVPFKYLPVEREVEAVVRHTACNPGLARHILAAVTLCRAGVDAGDVVDAPSIRSVVAYIRALRLLSPADAWISTIASRQPVEGQTALEAIRIASLDETLILKLLGE